MVSSFNMVASKEAFKILSENLYSNKKLAVIRELSTNANDAHKEANVDRPFLLHVPTRSEMFFDIRDFGNGLSEEMVMNIYTSFFVSTKTEDEEQTGYFGLGSKTPFAIVDRYFVSSYNGGKKKTYKMEKIDGIPTVEKIKEEDTNETGLQIHFDISSTYRIDDWCELARDFFKTADFMPESNCFKGVLMPDFLKIRDFHIHESYKLDGYPNIFVSVAGVGFSVDVYDYQVFPSAFRDTFRKNNLSVNIKASKNDVSITPSRENLHYDDKTIKFITEKYFQLVSKYYEQTEKNFDNLNLFDLMDISELTQKEELRKRAIAKIKSKIAGKILEFGRNRMKVSDLFSSASSAICNIPKHDSYTCVVVDFSDVPTAKQRTIKAFYEHLDDNNAKPSESFLRIARTYLQALNKVAAVIFPKNLDDSLEDLKKFIGEGSGKSIRVLSWKHYCESEKRESTGIKRGFKTKNTILVKKGENKTYFNYGRDDPNLQENEVGIILRPFEQYSQRQIDLVFLIKPDVTLVFRECSSQDIYNKFLEKGHYTLNTYLAKIIEDKENKAIIDKLKKNVYYLSRYLFLMRLRVHREVNDENIAIINDPKYDCLEKDEFFKAFRNSFKPEIVEKGELVPAVTLDLKEYAKSVEDQDETIPFDIKSYPMTKDYRITSFEDAVNLFDYMALIEQNRAA